MGKTPKLWSNDDLAFAFEAARDFLLMEEWPEDDGGAQVAAYREAARRIQRMADRLPLDNADTKKKARRGETPGFKVNVNETKNGPA